MTGRVKCSSALTVALVPMITWTERNVIVFCPRSLGDSVNLVSESFLPDGLVSGNTCVL